MDFSSADRDRPFSGRFLVIKDKIFADREFKKNAKRSLDSKIVLVEIFAKRNINHFYDKLGDVTRKGHQH